MAITLELEQLRPHDQYNEELERQVHPPDWINPTPHGRYNLVVVGAGTAGLVAAAGAAGLGAKVALIERDLMGGDCLNVGCVPSKGIISAARTAAAVRRASEFGVHVPSGTRIAFAEVMQRMRRLRAGISHHDSAARFRDLGVDVYLGQGSFIDKRTIEVAGQQLHFAKAVIATGARAAKLPIPGWDEACVLTNESLFSLTQLPRRLAVIGAGPIGTEMAQAFAEFGSEVTLIEKGGHILSREDADAAHIVQTALERSGVRIRAKSTVVELQRQGEERLLQIESNGQRDHLRVDEVLVGIGRQPNVDELNLEAAGIAYDLRQGVQVNDRLQTTNPRVYAAGDIASRFKFTHAADFLARTVLRNALFKGRSKASALVIPWSTYTWPELAHVGLSETDAARQGIEIDTYKVEMNTVDRAILEGEADGFVKIHTKKGSDKIVGATIVAANAGDMIGSVSIAMTHGIGLGKIASAIHPYPTQAEAIRKAGDLYNRTKLTPWVKAMFNKWLTWSR